MLKFGHVVCGMDYYFTFVILFFIIIFQTTTFWRVVLSFESGNWTFLVLAVYTFLELMFLISYFRTLCTNPGSLPLEWGMEDCSDLYEQFYSDPETQNEENANKNEEENEKEEEIENEKELGKTQEAENEKTKKKKTLKTKTKTKAKTKKEITNSQSNLAGKNFKKQKYLFLPNQNMGDTGIFFSSNSEEDENSSFVSKKQEKPKSKSQEKQKRNLKTKKDPKARASLNEKKKRENFLKDFKIPTFPITPQDHSIWRHRPRTARSLYVHRQHDLVLKADHLCTWVGNAIGFRNQKFFVLLLIYGFSLCLYSTVILIPLAFFDGHLFDIQACHCKAYAVISSLLSLVLLFITFILLISHIHLVLNNMTTVEQWDYWENPEKLNIYDLDSYKNWVQVFGTNKLLWFLPIYTSLGNGIDFPTVDIEESNIQGLGINNSSKVFYSKNKYIKSNTLLDI
ncbi:protein s-acyltransferase 16-related [Anaeramoeba flamelloides]|uniref:Palmitoyltransferase n=1 Tax=Anaeramoeba flamelloides TaxID=1746091 RepID=A0AAV7YF79_9EUKA|nr:protein s-acyltransferase 16-related [Anaeramoeba flamelloides]